MAVRFSRELLAAPPSSLRGEEFEFEGTLVVGLDGHWRSLDADASIGIVDDSLESRTRDSVPGYVGGRNRINDRAVLVGKVGVQDGRLIIQHVNGATVYRTDEGPYELVSSINERAQ